VGVAPGPGERTSKDDLVDRLAHAFDSADAIARMLDGAPRGTVDLFKEALLDGGVRVPYTYGFSPAARHRRPDLDWLLDRGLLMRANYDFAEVPREVSLTHRIRLVPRLQPAPPAADAGATTVDLASRDEAAARAATTIVALVDGLCLAWADDPPTTLRSTGGIGAREFKRLAKLLNADEVDIPFVIELAAAADLVTFESDRTDERVLPTEHYDEWRSLALAGRWSALIDAWRAAPRWLSLGGQRADDGKLIPALAAIASAHSAHTQRDTVLDALAALGDGVAPSPDALAAHVTWFAAGMWAGPAPAVMLVEWFLVEAERLGVTGHGALVRKDATELVGTASAEITLQADLTAITTGALVPDLAALLDDAADVESAGAATVWRFGEATIRRALDLGRDAGAIVGALEAAATKGVPQPLRYLIADVARRHGQLRVGGVASFVTSDDPALLAAAVRAKGAAKLGLRLVAPTVAVASAPVAKVLDALRAAGQFPVEVDEHGGAVIRGRSTRRAEPTSARAVVPMRARSPRRGRSRGDASAVVAAWRSAPNRGGRGALP
jgi:hypothetical protein